MADFILGNGLEAASLRPMAKAAGTSDRMLIYHFGSKAGVVQAALDDMVARNIALFDSVLPAEPMPADILLPLIETALQGELQMKSLAVFYELAARSLRGDPEAREVGERIARHLHEWLSARLIDPAQADTLLPAIEGWGLLSAVGLDLPFPTG